MIKRHEGLKLFPYKCSAGHLTIGYGHNLEANGLPESICSLLLWLDIKNAIEDLNKVFDGYFYTLSFTRQNVLTDMMFNLGLSRFSTFKKMIAAVKEGDFDKAVDEMKDSLWYRQVGIRGMELVKLMEKG